MHYDLDFDGEMLMHQTLYYKTRYLPKAAKSYWQIDKHDISVEARNRWATGHVATSVVEFYISNSVAVAKMNGDEFELFFLQFIAVCLRFIRIIHLVKNKISFFHDCYVILDKKKTKLSADLTIIEHFFALWNLVSLIWNVVRMWVFDIGYLPGHHDHSKFRIWNDESWT